MIAVPDVTVIALAYGPRPLAATLNPRLPADEPLLVATLDIAWAPREPAAAIATLEEALLDLSPGLAAHQCRGLPAYHVLLGAARARAGGRPPGDPEASADDRPAATAPYDARLAFAHLVEHAVIDFQCSISGRTRCSGVTAAHRGHDGRYDIMVEAATARIGRSCLALATEWLAEAVGGRPLGEDEREVLRSAAWLHGRDGGGWSDALLALALDLTPARARRVLAVLADAGYLETRRATMSLSDVRVYRVPRT